MGRGVQVIVLSRQRGLGGRVVGNYAVVDAHAVVGAFVGIRACDYLVDDYKDVADSQFDFSARRVLLSGYAG